MKKLTLIILTVAHLGVCAQESNFSLVSMMNGSHSTTTGENTIVWGYKLEGPGSVSIPAPLLEVMAGDSVHVSLFNDSAESHTIHWHGLDVDQANDGVPTTSFMVISGETGYYSFLAPDPGTYMYHCHVTTTIHLTMGMYGMFVVKYPGNLLYENGPGYSREYTMICSDMEIEANQAPTDAYPFHEITPDYFMINGLSGEELTDNSNNFLNYVEGDSIAVRLGNMAYSKVEYIFPEGSNHVVYQSDGRVLPEAFSPDTLEIWPGERFTLIMKPDETMTDNIIVDYYSMVNKELQGSNELVLEEVVSVDEIDKDQQIQVYPNPTNNKLNILTESAGSYNIYNSIGVQLDQIYLSKGVNILSLDHYPTGVYFLKNDKGSIRFVKD